MKLSTSVLAFFGAFPAVMCHASFLENVTGTARDLSGIVPRKGGISAQDVLQPCKDEEDALYVCLHELERSSSNEYTQCTSYPTSCNPAMQINFYNFCSYYRDESQLIEAGCCPSCNFEYWAHNTCVLENSPLCVCEQQLVTYAGCAGEENPCSSCYIDPTVDCGYWQDVTGPQLLAGCCDRCNSEAFSAWSCVFDADGCAPATPFPVTAAPVTEAPVTAAPATSSPVDSPGPGNSGPAPTGTPAPAPAPSSGGGFCFSESATVMVLHKGTVALKDLQVNDQVFTGDGFEPMYAFGHLDKESSTLFLQITTNQITPLELTASHMLFVAGQSYPAQAGSITVGDVLQGADDISAGLKVKKIKTIERKGLYAPLTPSGTLLVDGILASSYIALQDSHDTYLEIGGGWLQVAHSAFVHFYLTPFRLTCMGISTGLCQVHTEKGIPPYIDYGMKLVQWADQQPVVVQSLMLGVTLPIVLPLAALEGMFGASTVIPLLAVLSFMAVAVGAAKKRASLKVKVF